MEIQDGGISTGSSYNFGCSVDRSAIPSVNTMFSRVANTMEHRPASSDDYVYTKSNMAAAKPGVVITEVAS